MFFHASSTEIAANSKTARRSNFTSQHLICLALLASVAALPSASITAGPPAKDQPIVKAVRHPPAPEDFVRCIELYQAWSNAHSNEGIAFWSVNATAEAAIAACEQGDVGSGTKMLEQLLFGEAATHKMAMAP
jgi:hypothetical protein